MTTAPFQPVPAGSSRLTVPSVASRRRVAAGSRPPAQQPADTACRVADTYPELLTPDEFSPIYRSDEDDEPVPVRRLPVPSQRRSGVGSLLRLPAALGRSAFAAAHTTAALVALPGRVIGLMTVAEQTLSATRIAVTRTHELLDRVEAVTRTAEGVAHDTGRAVTAAAGTVEQAGALTARATALLDGYTEPLRSLEPLLRRLAETTQAGGVEAVVTLLDRLPLLADAMEREVIPLLGHLDQVGPDVNQLLDSVSRLNHLASRLPQIFRRRHHRGT
ncbi:MAG: hypothetical protein ACRDTE_19300 [Pseudonocardiaceae bacterium]